MRCALWLKKPSAAARAPVAGHAVWPHMLPDRVLGSNACYVIPRRDGRLVVGATVEHVGFAPGPTPRGIAAMLAAATELIPAIAELPVVETWAGFRPGTTDDLPIIGPDPDVGGLVYATGHYRNGILLAPITAACVTALVDGAPTPVALEAFGIERLDEERGT